MTERKVAKSGAAVDPSGIAPLNSVPSMRAGIRRFSFKRNIKNKTNNKTKQTANNVAGCSSRHL